MTIQQLPDKFIGTGDVKDFKFVKFKFSDKGFIYEIRINGILSHYEVFERKTTPICLNFEERIYSETEFKEMYPKSNDFGKWAWSCSNVENAFKRFNEL